MKQKHCDVPGCGKLIQGSQIALQPLVVKVPGVGQMSVAVTFKGKRPDICNDCILDAVTASREQKPLGNVVALAAKAARP